MKYSKNLQAWIGKKFSEEDKMIDLWMKNEEAKVDKKFVQHLKATTKSSDYTFANEQLAIEAIESAIEYLKAATTFSDNGFIELALKASERAVENIERDLYEVYD